MIFPRRLLLLATPRQIGVLDWRPRRLRWLGTFDANRDGLAAFHQVIAKHAHLPALLVADTVDEDYRSEILPHVRGPARTEMLARKLRQVFRNTRFTAAWRQTRETGGRRDDRYLLAALTDADWLTPWLGILTRERVPLAGLVPLALACQHLLGKLRLQEPHTLLACRLENRLRLSYYHNGLLRFSRLVASDTPTQTPGNAADEIAKTQLYLTGQRILPRDTRLQVLLLDPGGGLNAAQARLNADPAFSTRIINLADLSRALSIPADFLEATPATAPLVAIATATPALDLAPPELRQRYVEFRWRRGLSLAATTTAACGVALTAGQWLHAQEQHAQALALAQETARVDTHHAALTRGFPPLVIRPDQMAEALALAQQLNLAPLDVPAALMPLGRTLIAYPDVVIEAIEIEDMAAGTVSVALSARLAEFDGNYRAAMARIGGLATQLAAVPGVTTVEQVANPVDTDPGTTLIGKTIGTAAEETRFSLRLRVRAS
ncbi:MAG TPA: monoheme cytochrome SoxX [Thiobacillaceae bacterium]|nr:monoheme cytochrome SoxX [Thiobacillaceae bacterium]